MKITNNSAKCKKPWRLVITPEIYYNLWKLLAHVMYCIKKKIVQSQTTIVVLTRKAFHFLSQSLIFSLTTA